MKQSKKVVKKKVEEVKKPEKEMELSIPKTMDKFWTDAKEETIERPGVSSEIVEEVISEPVKSEPVLYRVIEALVSSEEQRIELFDKKISALIVEGWIPIGGLAVMLRDNVSWKLMQAMYKSI